MPPKKEQKALNEHSRTAELLVELVDDLDLIFTFGYQPFAVMKYGMSGIREMREARKRRRERETLRRLKEKKLIQIEKRAGDIYVALTETGAKEYLRLKVLDADLYEDDRECLVVFDIPESKRKLRKSLREFLSNAGFIPIQKSVWISKFDAGKAISKLLTVKGSKHWVRIFEVREQ
ncbi:MAG: CRISPR-associated endonuclease Cas2 [Patescibacteria group bacterium]